MAAGDVSVSLTNPLAKGGARFDGTNDYVSMPIVSEISPTKSFSITLWAKLDSNQTDAFGMLFQNAPASAERFGIYYTKGTTTVAFSYYNGSASVGKINTSTANGWHSIIATWDGSTAQLYIDGTIQTGTLVGNISSIDASLAYIGNNQVAGTSKIEGVIGDVRIYEVALTQGEATKVAAGELVTRGLIRRYPLISDYNDSVGTNHATNSGTRLVAQDSVLANVVNAARTSSADDYFFIPDINNKVMSVVIDEA